MVERGKGGVVASPKTQIEMMLERPSAGNRAIVPRYSVFAMAGSERPHEVIDSVFGFVLDVYQLHDFLPSAVPGLVFSFAFSGGEKKQAATVKGTERSGGRVGTARVAARPSGVHPQEAEWKDNAKALH